MNWVGRKGFPQFSKKILKRKDGSTFEISDVELIYGNPFRPANLDVEFWYTFETSLGKLDARRLNFFFGKDKKGLKAMSKSVVNANRILKEAFCRWIETIQITKMDRGICFCNNCYFINFNYTDTLEKRFGVRKEDIIHISIIQPRIEPPMGVASYDNDLESENIWKICKKVIYLS